VPQLQITTADLRGQRCYKLQGNLDLSARPRLAETIESHWESEKILRLDLSQVREIDLSGLSWLMLAETVMRQRGGRLHIVAASRPVQRAMQLLNPATRALFRPGHSRLPDRVHPLRQRGRTAGN